MSEVTAKQVILRAASIEFSRYGLAGSRMAKIAERADLNKALIHYYFKNKENLYLEVLQFSFHLFWDEVLQSIRPLYNSRNLSLVLNQFIQTAMDVFYREKDLRRLVIQELASGGAGIEKFELARCEASDPVGELLKYIVESQEFQNRTSENALHFFVNLMGMIMNTWLSEPLYKKRIKDIEPKNSKEFLNSRIQAIQEMIGHCLDNKKDQHC